MDFSIIFVVCAILVALAVYLLAVRHTAKLNALEDEQAPSLRCEVGAKGSVSVYGLQKNPVTLYANQWRQLDKFMATVIRFIDDNQNKLAESHNEMP